MKRTYLSPEQIDAIKAAAMGRTYAMALVEVCGKYIFFNSHRHTTPEENTGKYRDTMMIQIRSDDWCVRVPEIAGIAPCLFEGDREAFERDMLLLKIVDA